MTSAMIGKIVLLSSNILLELLCFLFSLLVAKKGMPWRLFPYVLGFTVIVESVGAYLVWHGLETTKFYLSIYIVFLFFWFYVLGLFNAFERRQKRILMIVGGVILLFLIGESWKRNFRESPSYSGPILLITVSVLCFYYLYRLLKFEVYVDFLKLPQFWIVFGLLIFAFGSVFALMFTDQLRVVRLHTGIPIRQYIFLFLNFFLYGFWSYAFLCSYRQSK